MSTSTSDTPLVANYDNNNEANATKMKQQMQKGTGAPVITSAQSGSSTKGAARSRTCSRAHLNSLWSVWYGFFGTFLQAYTAVKCTKRFLRYSVLPWTTSSAVWELQACLLVTGLAVLILPLFLAAAVFKVGNHANDGFKLGRTSSLCEKDPPNSLLGPRCSIWRHGGPSAAFLHLVIAFSLLVPKLVMEARLVEAGFLASDAIWRTDLDFMVVHHDRLVVLSFMTAASPSNSTTATVLPVGSTSVVESSTVTALLNSTKGPPAALPFSLVKVLKDFFNMDTSDNNVDSGFGSSVSVEYLNYALALFVYSVRYPAVFWNTNKCFGIIFSIQLLANGLQSLLAFAGMSVLYKVQIIGAWKALPLLRHYPDGMSPLGGKSPFLLNPHVTLSLFCLSSLLILSSSLILYLYGHGRFNSFLNQQRDKKHIFLPASSYHSWGYFTHCAALCLLVAVAVAYAPLLYDYTVVYRGSLDGAVLACIVATISHLFLWVLVWLFLTIKHKWTFKLRVTVGRATVRSARSVKLVTDIDLMGCRTDDNVQQPLLIVGNGRTYSVTEHSPKKAIMSVIQKAVMDKKNKQNSATNSSVGGSETADDDADEQIYWLRPALVTPQRSPDSAAGDRLCWFSSKKQAGQHVKHKVTFNEATSTSTMRNNKSNITKPKLRTTGVAGIDEDDGDYATLRELPLLPSMVRAQEDDTTSEEGKLTAGQTPRCLRRADSGMPHEELTPRSDSVSTESSSSPPEPPGSNHSETSSGISQAVSRRATSVADLVQPRDDHQWKSCSLQRNVQPPHSVYGYTTSLVTGSVTGYTTTNTVSNPRNSYTNGNSGCTNNSTSGSVTGAQAVKDTGSEQVILQRNQQPNAIYGYSSNNGIVTTDQGETIVVKPQTASYTPGTSQGIYGYTTASAKLTNGLDGNVQTVLVKPSATTSPHFSPSTSQSIYGFTSGNGKPVVETSEHGIPAVILENSAENTVVIRRKSIKPNVIDIQQIPVIKEEPFGRSTNMRMTSFTEHNDLGKIQASSATLPHYPTQPIPQPATYPHCSTMPLPHNSGSQSATAATTPNLGTGTSCNVYPRQHTTIPTHHNGVRLFPPNQNPYVKRLQNNYQNGGARVNNEGIYGTTTAGTNGKTSGEMYHYNS
ncbi:tincar [Carabus blaptoides fortunei]